METLTQQERSQLFKYDYYFTISYDRKENNKTYYLIRFGKGNDYFTFRNLDESYIISLRFSELRESNILLYRYPPRTLFYNNSEGFINNRLKQLKEWLQEVIENNKSNELFKYLTSLKQCERVL